MNAENQFLLPDLGEGLTEAEVITWLVAPGDVIEIDQLVVEVESAKSVVELPSPYGGRVERLDAAQGDFVSKGAPLLTISAVSGSDSDIPPAPDAQPVDPGGAHESPDLVPGTALREEEPGSGAVLVGYGTRESSVRLKRPEGGRFAARESSKPVRAASGILDPMRRSPVVSPLVRRLALSNGFDASQLLGSGPGALVRREDVNVAIAALASTIEPKTDASSGVSHNRPGDHDVRTPLTGMRKLIAARLSESRRIVPEATIWLDVDATELLVAKERLQRSTGERFSLTSLIARFTVAGLQQFPVLNSSLDETTNEIVQHGTINLGIAAQTARGLMVPVIHGAQNLTTRALRDEVAAMVAASEKGEYPPSVLSGGTFTLNNYGGFGVDGSTPIINYPEVAMLGIGRIIDRPWVVNGQILPRKIVTLSFVFDHRVCDGGVAAGFLGYVARCVEDPLHLLGNL